MVSGFTLEKPYCRHIGLSFGKRLDTILLLHRIGKYPDSPANSPGECGRKPYSERRSCGLKNIQIRVAGALTVKKHFVTILLNIRIDQHRELPSDNCSTYVYVVLLFSTKYS